LQAIRYSMDTLGQPFDRMPPLLTLQWLSTAAAVIVALAAFARARQVSRRLDRLTESYWELRYEYGQLRARVVRLEGQPEADAGGHPAEPASTAFVPLSSLKK
jgi:hypothetical protein